MANKINVTKNYRLFTRSHDNRQVDLNKHRKLVVSMKKYGFLSCFPIACYRDKDKHLIVKDGQHRLAIAEMLGLAVYWVEEETDFDMSITSGAGRGWMLRDFAQKYASNGVESYVEALTFVDDYKLPFGVGCAILAGTVSFTNIEDAFREGKFKVRDRDWAHAVAGIYSKLTALGTELRNARFLEACMAVCRVPDFEPERLIGGAERCRDKLVSYSTKDAYMELIEELYNFGRKQLVGLKIAAQQAMRERSATTKAKAKKATKPDQAA